MRLLVVCLMMLSISMHKVSAQQFHINIHGIPFNCTANNGQPVPIFTDFQSAAAAAKLGGARADLVPGFGYRISLNIAMLSQTPPRAAVLVFYHECGHVALPLGIGMGTPAAERNADCWAVQQMVLDGFIQNRDEFEEAVQYVIQIGGLNGMTQARIAHMWMCIQQMG